MAGELGFVGGVGVKELNYAASTLQGRRASAWRKGLTSMSQLNWSVGFDGEPITSARDPSREVFERRRVPGGKPAAAVLVLHGFLFHSGWYAELAEGLCKDSQAVVHGLDLPSHGKSDDIDGFRMYAKEPEDFMDEIEAALLRLKDSVAPGTPLFLLGESFGGLLSLQAVLKPDLADLLKGVILCSPLVRIEEMSMPLVKGGLNLMRNLTPEWELPDVISKTDWDKMFGDAEAAAFSKEDPLSGYNTILRCACGALIMDLSNDLEQSLPRVTLDNLLILHKELDHRSSISNSELIMKKATVFQRKELVKLPGEGHAVFGDIPEQRTANIQKIASFVSDVSADSAIEGAVEQSKPATPEPAAPVRVIKVVKSQARDAKETEPGFEVLEAPSPVATTEESAASNGVPVSAVQDAKPLAASEAKAKAQVFRAKQVTSKPIEETPQAPPKPKTIVVVKSAPARSAKKEKLIATKTPTAKEWRAYWKSPRRSGGKNIKRLVDLAGIDMLALERFNFAVGFTTSITSRIEDIPRETTPPPPVDVFWKDEEAKAAVQPVEAASSDIQSGVALDDVKLARVSMKLGKEPTANGTAMPGERPTSAYLKSLSRNNPPQGPAIANTV
ncbi:hypothetical protein NDN08_004543 [Rhodosorus marinus]|uniref:Serine aminopeptidase S33 domain-containing protein n=1 Tax=Rhodosorus marinus TaxID=101924 RepID=A0AAV8ULJ9_9RHOD|nr:hypothetical protein NDN08_004543 [Rhodosorus marinus]